MMVAVVTRYVCAEYMDLDDWVTCNNPSGRVDMSSIITNHPLRFFIGAVAVPLAPSSATPAPPLPPGQETSCLSPASYRCERSRLLWPSLDIMVWFGVVQRKESQWAEGRLQGGDRHVQVTVCATKAVGSSLCYCGREHAPRKSAAAVRARRL